MIFATPCQTLSYCVQCVMKSAFLVLAAFVCVGPLEARIACTKDVCQGSTPLMEAALSRSTSEVQSLVDVGAEVNAEDACGDTPLLCAIYKRSLCDAEDPRLVQLLIDAGSSIEHANSSCMRPLLLAARNGYPRCIEVLVRAGADLEARGEKGRTALCYAVEFGEVEAACSLLRAGAEVNCRDDLSLTPLMLASFRQDSEIVELLLSEGADIHARTTQPFYYQKRFPSFGIETVASGATALTFAKQYGSPSVQRMLSLAP
jgi:ankyrin repeat protein